MSRSLAELAHAAEQRARAFRRSSWVSIQPMCGKMIGAYRRFTIRCIKPFGHKGECDPRWGE